MNFLAHLHLSGNQTKILIGNFIADFVKGKNALALYEPEIVLGVELHRTIDAFTDSHLIVKQSKSRLTQKYRHYSGVIVDMFYDHFLAKHWSSYHATPLAEYSQSVYQTLNKNISIFPEDAKRMLPFMATHNWLVGYGTEAGLHRALSGMARRTPYESKMEEAIADLTFSYDLFQNEFHEFFPILQRYSQEWLAEKKMLSLNVKPPPIG